MPRWSRFAILFAVFMYGALDGCASEMPRSLHVEAMCFEHFGPQDKPMPVFCVSESGAVLSIIGASDVPPIQLTSVIWKTLLDLVEREGSTDLSYPTVFGEYQVKLIPVGKMLYLSPKSTLKVALALSKVKSLNDAQSQMLQRLRLRLREYPINTEC